MFGTVSRSLIAPLATRFFTPTLAPIVRTLSSRLGSTCRPAVRFPPIGINRRMRFLHDKTWSDSPFPAGPSRSSVIVQSSGSRSFGTGTGQGGLGMSYYVPLDIADSQADPARPVIHNTIMVQMADEDSRVIHWSPWSAYPWRLVRPSDTVYQKPGDPFNPDHFCSGQKKL